MFNNLVFCNLPILTWLAWACRVCFTYHKAKYEFFEAKPLVEWGWVDSVIVVPATEKSSLLHSALTTCVVP